MRTRAFSFNWSRSSSQFLRPPAPCSRNTTGRVSRTSGITTLRRSSCGRSMVTSTAAASIICFSVAQSGFAKVTASARMRGRRQPNFNVRSPLMARARPVRSSVERSIGPRSQFQPKMAMKTSARRIGASSTPAIHLSERESVMAAWAGVRCRGRRALRAASKNGGILDGAGADAIIGCEPSPLRARAHIQAMIFPIVSRFTQSRRGCPPWCGGAGRLAGSSSGDN